MATTRRAGLTLMPSNVLKNEAIFNQDITLLEVLVYGGVISQSLLDPSGISPAPTNGDAYIVPQGSPSPTGDFSGKEGQVAVYFDGWRFIPADEGLQLRVIDEDTNYRFENGAWTLVTDTTDTNAIHDNVANEIAAVAAKASPTTGDFLLIEDAADSNAKKRITIGDLPGAGTTLASLTDVDISGSPSPSNRDSLVFNLATGKWEARRPRKLFSRLTASGSTSIPNNTSTTLAYATEQVAGDFRAGAAANQFVVPPGVTHVHLTVEASCSSLNAQGNLILRVLRGGATIVGQVQHPTVTTQNSELVLHIRGLPVSAGQTFTAAMFQDGTGTETANSVGSGAFYFMVEDASP